MTTKQMFYSTFYLNNCQSSLSNQIQVCWYKTCEDEKYKHVWYLLFVFDHGWMAVQFSLCYSYFILHFLKICVNFCLYKSLIQIPRMLSRLAWIYSVMLVYFHFCPCSFHPMTINSVERVKGRVNTGTLTWISS